MRYALFLLILVLFAGVGVSRPDIKIARPDAYFFTASPSAEKYPPEIVDPFKDLTIEAESAVLLDLSGDKIIFKKNSDFERPLASLTKLVTAAVFYDLVEDILSAENAGLPIGQESASIVIPITSEAVKQEGDDGFLVNESFRAEDLVSAMLVRSSNDAAYALSSWLQKKSNKPDSLWFVNEMNVFVSGIGLHQTYFLNPTGLDVDDYLAGAYGTAEEMARLFSWLIKNKFDIISATSGPQITVYSVQGKKHIFESIAVPVMPIPELISAKTGYTELAGGNLVFAFGLGVGRQFIAVVLGSSYEGRFEDAMKLYAAASRYVKNL